MESLVTSLNNLCNQHVKTEPWDFFYNCILKFFLPIAFPTILLGNVERNFGCIFVNFPIRPLRKRSSTYNWSVKFRNDTGCLSRVRDLNQRDCSSIVIGSMYRTAVVVRIVLLKISVSVSRSESRAGRIVNKSPSQRTLNHLTLFPHKSHIEISL